MLNVLKEKNRDMTVYSVLDPEFAKYGTILDSADFEAVSKAAELIPMPEAGSAYRTFIPELEAAGGFTEICQKYCAGQTIQIGLCWGYNSMLDALEYHTCNELNVAVTDMVILLAKRADIKDGILSSDDIVAFYVPKGTAIEVYSDTLHYCPCQTSDSGFRSIVVLLRGTNEELRFTPGDPRIIGQNKWVLFHSEAVPENGYSGIRGTNYKIRY